MTKSNFDQNQKELLQRILDYNLRLDSPEDRAHTESLLQENEQAKKLHDSLQLAMNPLGHWSVDPPAGDLSPRTLAFIKQHEQSAQLLAQSSAAIAAQVPPVISGRSAQPGPLGAAPLPRRGFWVMTNLRDLAAVAAGIMILIWVMQPALNHARHFSQQTACAANLRSNHLALKNYAADNSGFLPYVRQKKGDVWWNIGDEGERNRSNTRSYFLLVRGNYLNASDFFCSGTSNTQRSQLTVSPEILKNLKDFMCRADVNYSFRLIFDGKPQPLNQGTRYVIIADQNPLFADVDSDNLPNKPLTLTANLNLRNSPNHARRGQNILTIDGAVRFKINPLFGPRKDNIFTIRTVNRYRGNELPGDDDTFMAP
ncbi:MAG: hypothetical protein IID32_04825 [Planctomycetes bacterium]|nr:hypothetical protein [Planctomycetota bacterium]